MAKNKSKSNNARNQQGTSGSRTAVKNPPAPKLAREETMQQGIAASEAGEKEKAYGIFQDVAREYPDALEAWVWMGWSSPTLDDSEKSFRKAFALDPTNEEAVMGMRWVQSQRDEEAAAISPLGSSIEPETAVRTGPIGEAATTVTETTSGNGRSSGVLSEPHSVIWSLEEGMQHGISAVEQGDKLVAYSTFQQMTSTYPDAVDTWVWLGGTSPTLEEAEAAFARARDLDQDNEMATLGLRWATLRRHALAEQGSSIGSHKPNITGGLDRLMPPQASADAVPVPVNTPSATQKGFAGPLQPLINRWGGSAVAILAAAVVIDLLILLWLLLGAGH
ncbi:MAG: hypothetical protein M3014_04825 [Chloroflexota bacterium]|nr:hypothetical protein [Chloroflexota bacterium]